MLTGKKLVKSFSKIAHQRETRNIHILNSKRLISNSHNIRISNNLGIRGDITSDNIVTFRPVCKLHYLDSFA